MTRKNAAAREQQPIPRHFSFRPTEVLNVEVREYLIANGISFNDLCESAVIEFLQRHPRWPKHDLRLPRGKRPKLA